MGEFHCQHRCESSVLTTMTFGILLIFIASTFPYVGADSMPTCHPEDFHYEYTTCDSTGGRWRVSVPDPKKCTGGAPNPPIRGANCSFTCSEGQFLNLNDDQQTCKSCPAGTYSLGGGVRYNDWTKLPEGFNIESSGFIMDKTMDMFADDDNHKKGDANCTDSQWHPAGDYIGLTPKDCSSTLMYATTLVQPGMVTFEYQHTNPTNFFKFTVQNDKCQSLGDTSANKWPKVTKNGRWSIIKVMLKTGSNILSWKVMNFGIEHSANKPVLLRNIQISGIAFTSECTSCPAGTHSKGGTGRCDPCPENTRSDKRAESCTSCDDTTQYSPSGSSKCLERVACMEEDYFAYTTPCDKDHKTGIEYKWIQPHVCRTNLVGATDLPASPPLTDCPACNVGMSFNKTGCKYCAHDEFSDGTKPCTKCPPSTSPQFGHDYKWWYDMPRNMTTDCLSTTQSGCATKQAWIPSGDSIKSGQGKYDDSYLLLSLDVAGFHGKAGRTESGKPIEVGKIEFEFETQCEAECSFLFALEGNEMDTMIMKTWTGKQAHQTYKYSVITTDPITFTWAFQKVNLVKRSEGDTTKFDTDKNYARIFSMKITNTIDGGVLACTPCPRGVVNSGCIPCQAGHYIDGPSNKCVQCPKDTVVDPADPWGLTACKKCGEGLKAQDGKMCVSDCVYTSPAGRKYDFSSLGKSIHSVEGSRLFTSGGAKYFHNFNITLCPGDERPLVTCVRNITAELQSRELDKKQHDFVTTEVVHAAVCRATIIPEQSETLAVLSAHPVSLGDHLTKIVINSSLAEQYKKEGYNVEGLDNDVHFIYESTASSTSCANGRTTTISMRCDIKAEGDGTIELPPKCSDGTCDGCNFHLLWHTMFACPLCVEKDYMIIVGECVSGEQILHYTPPLTCLPNTKIAGTKTRECSVLPYSVKIGLIVGAAVGVVMCLILLYCWKRNRKLEYKYMKLVQNSSGKDDGELPAAETCALDEGEDEQDHADTVHFSQTSGIKLLKKLKDKISGKNKDFEEYRLSESEHLT